MTTTNATSGFGSQIYVSPNGSTWTMVGQGKDLKSPEPDLAKVKVTNNSSPNRSQEYIPGIFDPGDLEFELVYESSVQTILAGYFAAATIVQWKEIFPDALSHALTAPLSHPFEIALEPFQTRIFWVR